MTDRHLPKQPYHFTHPLLRARDWQDRPELAALSLADVRARLGKLAAMRLLEPTERETHGGHEHRATVHAVPTVFSGVEGTTWAVHPAVRDGFLSGLGADRARSGHAAACRMLIASPGGLPGRGANPSDARELDLLEEITYHTLEAGLADTAWEVYRYQLGGYENLGRRLGAYERGERICRAFAAGQSAEAAPLPNRLAARDHAVFLNEWALYLSDLGRLQGAARCYERNIALRLDEASWKNASIGNQNLTDLLLAAGRLRGGLAAAEEAVRLAELAAYAFERKDAYAYRGYARASPGRTAPSPGPSPPARPARGSPASGGTAAPAHAGSPPGRGGRPDASGGPRRERERSWTVKRSRWSVHRSRTARRIAFRSRRPGTANAKYSRVQLTPVAFSSLTSLGVGYSSANRRALASRSGDGPRASASPTDHRVPRQPSGRSRPTSSPTRWCQGRSSRGLSMRRTSSSKARCCRAPGSVWR